MPYLIAAADRAAFKRCRRQWDYGATARRRLEPERPAGLDLERAVLDALAVYYFPGMWDWSSEIVLPLVRKALADALDRQQRALGAGAPDADRDALLERGTALLERYFAWAPGVDRLSPVRVEMDVDVMVEDPADPERGIAGPGGQEIRYTARLALLATDEHDRFWVVRHHVPGAGFLPAAQLLLDEEAVTACWAWERFSAGLEVAGTVHNELTEVPSGAPAVPAARPAGDHPRGGVPQHEASGGGRESSTLRRVAVRDAPAAGVGRVRRIEGHGFRRTVIARGRAEIRAAGARLAEEALDMVDPGLRAYPSPSPAHCPACAFLAPCLAVEAGGDAEVVLGSGYRQRPAVPVEIGRLGGSSFGVGRGGVPGGRPGRPR